MLWATIIMAAASVIGPTYLSCQLEDTKEPLAINLTIDEPNQIMTIEIPKSGGVQRRPALFSATEVTANVPLGRGIGQIYYTVSRTDLRISRTIASGNYHNEITGKCVLQATPQRAF